MRAGEKHPSHSAGTVQESTAFALVRENNEYSNVTIPVSAVHDLPARCFRSDGVFDHRSFGRFSDFPFSHRTSGFLLVFIVLN